MKVQENEGFGVAAPPAQASTHDDSQLIAALEEYLTALETGQRLDRQEFLARHAAIAGVLAESLDSLEFVQIAAPRLHPAAPPHTLFDEAAAAAVISTLTMQRGQRFFRAAAQLGVQVAEALDHAHQLGIVHRDIKPAGRGRRGVQRGRPNQGR